MKSISKIIFPLLAVIALVSWVGCNTAYPTNYLSSSGPSAAMVLDFEGGSPLSVNPSLAEANRPNNVVFLPGSLLLAGGTNVVATGAVVSPGANGTVYCYHASGSVTDLGNASYPSIQVQVPLDKAVTYSAFFDAELFTGIKFYLKVMGSDNAAKRTFSLPVAQTQPPSAGGDCNPGAASNACYNDFNVVYSNTNGAWQLLTCPFSSFTRGSYGASISPATLSGLNLKQILMLDWTEGNSNAVGIANVDFYIDEIDFF